MHSSLIDETTGRILPQPIEPAENLAPIQTDLETSVGSDVIIFKLKGGTLTCPDGQIRDNLKFGREDPIHHDIFDMYEDLENTKPIYGRFYDVDTRSAVEVFTIFWSEIEPNGEFFNMLGVIHSWDARNNYMCEDEE